MSRARLLCDCDTGIDDASALAYLGSLDHVQIKAVTITPGNVDVEQVTANNRALLKHCGKPDDAVLIGVREPLEIPLARPLRRLTALKALATRLFQILPLTRWRTAMLWTIESKRPVRTLAN